jgi:hypothetical protein
MRALKFTVFAMLAFTLGGCVSSTSTTLKTINGGDEVKVTRTTTGLIWGPCMPAPGSLSVAYAVDFTGEKSVYTPKEFALFREVSNGPRVKVTVEKGSIEIDRTKHEIKIDLTVAGKACELNGHYT